jgi:hypothetical protein
MFVFMREFELCINRRKLARTMLSCIKRQFRHNSFLYDPWRQKTVNVIVYFAVHSGELLCSLTMSLLSPHSLNVDSDAC